MMIAVLELDGGTLIMFCTLALSENGECVGFPGNSSLQCLPGIWRLPLRIPRAIDRHPIRSTLHVIDTLERWARFVNVR